jgi:hypothetical protein
VPVWKLTPIAQRPSLTLRDWAVFEVLGSEKSTRRTLHFVGYNVTEFEGRVSSHVCEFDATTRRGRTKSGRVYELLGRPGMDADAEYTWNMWRAINEVTDVEDVTHAFLPSSADSEGGP